MLVENLSYAIGNLRTLRTRQFVDNLSYVHGAHTIKSGFNLRFLAHQDTRGSIAGQNANQTVNFDPGINTVDPATFGLPADLNVQYDRPSSSSATSTSCSAASAAPLAGSPPTASAMSMTSTA